MTHEISFQIIQQRSPLFKLIEEAFNSKINALYDNQCSTLEKLTKLDDRYCEIMFIESQSAGFLIYKRALQQEFGLKDAFELKTLFVFNPEKNARRGIGSLLFRRANALALGKKAECIYSTVVAQNIPIISCATKNGFIITMHGQDITQNQRKNYPLETNELLLVKYSNTL